MQAPEFAHLRLRTEYSIREGISRLQGEDSVVAHAAEIGIPALALADADNMFGAVKFYAECRKRGVKPVIGCDASAPVPGVPEARLLLLCASQPGFVNLSRLLSRAYAENNGKIKFKPNGWTPNPPKTSSPSPAGAAAESGSPCCADSGTTPADWRSRPPDNSPAAFMWRRPACLTATRSSPAPPRNSPAA